MVVAMNNGMDNNINKASFPLLAVAAIIIAAIGTKIRAYIEAKAPQGYEDAAGFHLGTPGH
jgi:hypothetical protein